MSEPHTLTPEEVDGLEQVVKRDYLYGWTRGQWLAAIRTLRAAWAERDAALARLAEYERFAEFARPILHEERAQFPEVAEWEDQRRREAQP